MENETKKSNVIELKPRELHIKKLDSGELVVQIKGGTAFDSSFVQECQEKGVQMVREKDE